jgi:hypothetical protein
MRNGEAGNVFSDLFVIAALRASRQPHFVLNWTNMVD